MGKKLKTYSEEQGAKPINWRAWINSEIARIGDRITLGKGEHFFDSEEMYNRAGQWVTCACGNQCAIIPRQEEEIHGRVYVGKPLDVDLARLGLDFYQVVADFPGSVFNTEKATLFPFVGRFVKALEILDKIEARSAVLIDRELRKRRNRRKARK